MDSIHNYLQLKKELKEEYDNRNSYAQIKKRISKKNGVVFEEKTIPQVINLTEEVIFTPEINETPVEIVEDSKPDKEEVKEQIVTTVVEPVFNIPPQLAYELYRHKKEIERLQKELDFIKNEQINYQKKVVPPFFGGPSGGGELNNLRPISTSVDYEVLGSGGRDLVLCDTELNDINITLPRTSMNHGFIVHVKKVHSNHQVYIRGYDNTQLIDGQEWIVIKMNMVTLQIVTDGSNWYIV